MTNTTISPDGWTKTQIVAGVVAALAGCVGSGVAFYKFYGEPTTAVGVTQRIEPPPPQVVTVIQRIEPPPPQVVTVIQRIEAPPPPPSPSTCYETKAFGWECMGEPCKRGLHEIWNCDIRDQARVRCEDGVVVAERCRAGCRTNFGGQDDECK